MAHTNLDDTQLDRPPIDRAAEIRLPEPQVVGIRARIGVVLPSANSVVEHDLALLGVRGVTFHAARMYVEPTPQGVEGGFLSVLGHTRAAMRDAIRDVLTCDPTYLMMATTAETFWGGVEGNHDFEARVVEQSGLGVTTGATAIKAALDELGCKRIAILTPYKKIADREARQFFDESSFETVNNISLECRTPTDIARIDSAMLIDALRSLNSDDIDAIVQCGTNLSMVRLADEAERWLGKPVLAINAVTAWHALRSCGIDDQFDGLGSVLREL